MDKLPSFNQYARLPDANDNDDLQPGRAISKRRWLTFEWLPAKLLLLAVISLLVYIAVILTILLGAKREGPQKTHFTLAQDILEYEDRPEWSARQHPWNLAPSPELDRAWNVLLYGLNLRVTDDELSRLNENKTNRVRVTGGDYLATMGVMHHLHCLNNLRRVIHWDYYGPLETSKEQYAPEAFEKEHSDHCIDSIRQALMCHANSAVYTAEWKEGEKRPSNDILGSAVTTCVKWDSIHNWASQRALVPGQYQYLAESR